MDQAYNISKIFDVVVAFNSESRYEEMLNIILTNMMAITNSDAGTLYIKEDNKLHFRITKNKTLGIHQSIHETAAMPPVSLLGDSIENVSAYAAIKNEIIVIDDIYTSTRFNFEGTKKYDTNSGYRCRSMLTLPLTAYWNKSMEVMGVIQLINSTDPATGKISPYGDVFNPPIIPGLANVAANTLANHIHIREIRALFLSFVSAMARAIDERSKYNSNHTQKVTALCNCFAEYLVGKFPEGHPFHFDELRRDELHMAATLHDIGKIVTPLEIMDKADRLGGRLPIVQSRFEIRKLQLENAMLKGEITREEYESETTRLAKSQQLVASSVSAPVIPEDTAIEILKLAGLTYVDTNNDIVPLFTSGDIESLSVRRGTLTDREREIMQEHVSVTNRILHDIAFSKYYSNVPDWASHHHEFLDGSGYPGGLKSAQLCPESCIITIMDIFEALTASDRPYKKAMSVEAAFSILTEMADQGKLNKELVNLFKESEIWGDLI